MPRGEKIFSFFYSRLLSGKIREKSEIVIISVTIISFILHLLLVSLSALGILHTMMILVAVFFGVMILFLHNRFGKLNLPEEKD